MELSSAFKDINTCMTVIYAPPTAAAVAAAATTANATATACASRSIINPVVLHSRLLSSEQHIWNGRNLLLR